MPPAALPSETSHPRTVRRLELAILAQLARRVPGLATTTSELLVSFAPGVISHEELYRICAWIKADGLITEAAPGHWMLVTPAGLERLAFLRNTTDDEGV